MRPSGDTCPPTTPGGRSSFKDRDPRRKGSGDAWLGRPGVPLEAQDPAPQHHPRTVHSSHAQQGNVQTWPRPWVSLSSRRPVSRDSDVADPVPSASVTLLGPLPCPFATLLWVGVRPGTVPTVGCTDFIECPPTLGGRRGCS